MWWTPRGHKWRHNMAHALCAGLARLYARMRMHTPTRSDTLIRPNMRPISNTYCFSTVTIIRERDSVLRYTYIACLVYFKGATYNKTQRIVHFCWGKWFMVYIFWLKMLNFHKFFFQSSNPVIYQSSIQKAFQTLFKVLFQRKTSIKTFEILRRYYEGYNIS
jgi:hypothetical protein